MDAADIFISMAKDRWPNGEHIAFSIFTSDGEESELPSTGAFPDHLVCVLKTAKRTYTAMPAGWKKTKISKKDPWPGVLRV